MAAISVRDLDDEVKERIRIRAASHGRSMEAEIRLILSEAVADSSSTPGLLGALATEFGAVGGVDIDLPGRTTTPRSPDFSS